LLVFGSRKFCFHEECFILAEKTQSAGIANSLTGGTLADIADASVKIEHMKSTIYIFVILIFCTKMQSQNNNLYLLQIEKFVLTIDSLKAGNDCNYFDTKIADGIIKTDNGKVGGFGIETLSRNDTIYKIDYSGGIDLYSQKKYYYKSNKLVYARLEISNNIKNQGTIFLKHEFYKDGKIISSRIIKNILTPEDKISANFSLYEDGIEMFKDESNIR